MQVGGSIALWLEYLLPDPTAPGLIPSIPNFFQMIKLSTLLRLINGTGYMKVYDGLKMFIEPIYNLDSG